MTKKPSSTSTIRAMSFKADDLVRILVGIILLTAAGMKGYELATRPVITGELLTTRWIRIVLIESELALGTCLVVGLWRQAIWRTTIICFVCFIGITVYKIWQGETSCGCFGRQEVNPHTMLILDCLLVVSMLMVPPRAERIGRGLYRRIALAGIVLSIGIPGAVVMASPRIPMIKEGYANDSSSLVILEPSTWVGHQMPILSHIDVGSQLKSGHWIVVLYHSDCSTCKRIVPSFESAAANTAGVTPHTQIALIEMPPYSSTGRGLSSNPSFCLVGQLKNDRDWFGKSPMVFKLDDGKVVSDFTELPWQRDLSSDINMMTKDFLTP